MLNQRSTVITLVSALAAGMLSVGMPEAAVAAPVATNDAVVGSSAALSPELARTAKNSSAAAQRDALASYWTADRMKAARPDSELPAMQTAAAVRRPQPQASATDRKPQGAPQRIAGAAPKTTPRASQRDVSQPDVSTQAYYPNYPVGHPVARTVGKVFFTSFGVNYVCSGAVVNSEGKSEVWTAGHCVSGGSAWHYNWVFVPNYIAGSAPYGYWYAAQLWTTTAWFYNNADYANDVGAAVMYRNNGWRITDYLGGQGIAWNYGVGYYVYAYGYPQGPPYNGAYLVAEQNYLYNGGGGTVYMVNYMTGGSSGGPWLNWFDGNWGYINGHNDFKYTAYPQYMFSPYYGSQVESLYNQVRNISA